MQINMLEAKNRLSSLVGAAERGEEVLIARNGVPVAKLVKYSALPVKPPGAWKNKTPYADEWNTPDTNAEVERLFTEFDHASTA